MNLGLLSLDLDVLSYIISNISYRDALSLSRTCKAARTLPLEPSLRIVVLDGTSMQLIKFRDFLLAKESRPLLLKSLVVTKTVTWDMDGSCEGPMVTALADILERASKLQHFSCGAMAILAKQENRVQKSLIHLPQLTDLSILEAGPQSMDIVMSSKSRQTMQRLTLEMCSTLPNSPLRTFVKGLGRFNNLHSLSITRLYSQLRIPYLSELDTVLPSMRELVLSCTWIPMSQAATVFPNLTRITFTNAKQWPKAQTPTTPSDEDTAVCWCSLDEAHIDARDLLIWPISCRVRWLDLDVLRDVDEQVASTAVRRMNPFILSCAYTMGRHNFFWEHLHSVGRELRFIDVRLLELSAHPMEPMLSELCHSCHELTVIFLCIRAFNDPEDAHAECATIAQRLAEGNADLQFVGLSFTDGRSTREDEPVWDEELHGSTWFKIRRTSNLESRLLQGETDEGEPGVRVEVKVIPTMIGLKVRDYMYEANYEAPNWVERLSTFA
ncbi:hypothetical protein C8Q79DRAFT_907300 [Trametes meyenii]|nr:hypothetical protein C8Q79DRAFT_907300 [Trametes meyenii]